MNRISKISGLRAVLTATLCLTVILCSACNKGRTEPPAQSPRDFEGNISPLTSFSVSGLAQAADISLLNDGNKTSGCVLQPDSNGAVEITADMGAVYRICRLDIYPASDGEFMGRFFPGYFEVQWSVDGQNFTKAAIYNNIDAPDCVPVLEFSPVNARFVRLVITGFRGSPDVNKAELSEIEIISFFGEYGYPA